MGNWRDREESCFRRGHGMRILFAAEQIIPTSSISVRVGEPSESISLRTLDDSVVGRQAAIHAFSSENSCPEM